MNLAIISICIRASLIIGCQRFWNLDDREQYRMKTPGMLNWSRGGHIECKTDDEVCAPESVLSYSTFITLNDKGFTKKRISFEILKRPVETLQNTVSFAVLFVALILVVMTYMIEFVYVPYKK